MESHKMKQEELIKKIEEMREIRKIKEKARLDKLRTLNMKKYNTEGKASSVFQNSKLPTTQSRPKNFNSMTDLRRKSMIPKCAPKSAPIDKTSQLPHVDDASINAKVNNGVSDVAHVSNGHNSSDLTVNPNLHASNIPAIIVNEPTSSIPTIGSIAAIVSNKDPTVKSNESNMLTLKGTGGRPKLNHKPSMADTKPEKPKQVRKSIAVVSKQRKSMAAGPSKPGPIKKDVPDSVSNPGQSKIALKKPLPIIPSVSSDNTKKNMDTSKNETNKNSTMSHKKSLPVKTDAKTLSKISVFERLYKPKNQAEKPPVSHRKETIFEQKNRLVAAFAKSRRSMVPAAAAPDNAAKVRRSISAVHFKRIGKGELKNCHHRYSSFGEGLDKVDLTKINEDEPVAKPQVVSMVRSEKKKTVKFQTATPRADELEHKLKSWLQRRGKSLDSFHHLRCFGVDRLAPSEKDIFNVEPYDEENKENIEIEDDGSVTELMHDRVNDFEEMKMKWRRASCFNDSEVYSESTEAADKSLVSTETPIIPVDELLLGALADLTQLVRDGYDWEQCARWLRAIRNRSQHATELAAYWECRAALEEGRGNLPRSCLCWEEAIAKGIETSVMEASLDQLLDKFMQLNISPERARTPLNAREMLCAKNVFKSSLIRFAVQNAKAKNEMSKYTVTPVRRSSRISCTPGGAGDALRPRPASAAGDTPRPRGDARTPLLQLASSLRHIDEDIRSNSIFVPNKLLQYSP